MSKRAALLLIVILTVSSLIAVKPAYSSITKPSVPEFTVNLVDSSYDVPTTYSTNPYTGEKVTHPGYRVESRTIEIKIKNQPFTPFLVEEATANWTADLQYNIRWKGHFEQDWHEIYYPSDGFAGANLESEYTVISFEGEYSSSEGLKLIYQGMYTTFPPGAQVDFQVEAMIGYVHRQNISIAVPGSGWVFTGETSDWSNTQTITISASSTPSPSPIPSIEPTQSPEPQQTEPFPTTLVTGVIVAVAIVGIGLVIYFRKRNSSG
jgi:hypothetical protein